MVFDGPFTLSGTVRDNVIVFNGKVVLRPNARVGGNLVTRQKPTIEPALQGFVDGYREALASGAAKQTGEGKLDGTPVVWLSFALPGGDSEEVAVAKDTGRPLFVKMCSGPCWTYRIKTIETISVDSADFSRPAESEAAKHEFSGGKNERTVSPAKVMNSTS